MTKGFFPSPNFKVEFENCGEGVELMEKRERDEIRIKDAA